MKADGRRIARLFRQYRNLTATRQCDVDSLVADDGLEIVESRYENPGYTACLLRAPSGEPGGLIALARGQEGGRRRFSIAHELGHYHIPSHSRMSRPPCAEKDMRARARDGAVEWEANDFAAELLMPWALFAADAERLEPSFASVTRLAAPDMYHVSVTAAAWRFVQVTDQACALVVLESGEVAWVVRSRAFSYQIPERRQRVNRDSIAHAVASGETAAAGLEQVPAHAWLERTFGEEPEVWESTHAITRLGQVLSLVWVIESEDGEDS